MTSFSPSKRRLANVIRIGSVHSFKSPCKTARLEAPTRKHTHHVPASTRSWQASPFFSPHPRFIHLSVAAHMSHGSVLGNEIVIPEHGGSWPNCLNNGGSLDRGSIEGIGLIQIFAGRIPDGTGRQLGWPRD